MWVGLVNTRNEYISDNLDHLTVNLWIKGSDGTTKDLTALLFDKTYNDISLSYSDYPRGQGFVILFNELDKYEKMRFAALWATVTLPNGKIVKSYDGHGFDLKPITYGK